MFNEKANFTSEFLSRKESAAFLKISISNFDKLKDLDCIKFGKRKIFSIDVLRQYAFKHTVRGIDNE